MAELICRTEDCDEPTFIRANGDSMGRCREHYRQQQTEYHRSYRARRREELAEYQRTYYAGRREDKRVWRKQHATAHPEQMRAKHFRHRLKTYGLTEEDYQRLVTDQSGKCALCRTKPIEHIDHDHVTGQVRGLLCQPCNLGLGMFGDSEDGLLKALAYLRGER